MTSSANSMAVRMKQIFTLRSFGKVWIFLSRLGEYHLSLKAIKLSSDNDTIWDEKSIKNLIISHRSGGMDYLQKKE